MSNYGNSGFGGNYQTGATNGSQGMYQNYNPFGMGGSFQQSFGGQGQGQQNQMAQLQNNPQSMQPNNGGGWASNPQNTLADYFSGSTYGNSSGLPMSGGYGGGQPTSNSQMFGPGQDWGGAVNPLQGGGGGGQPTSNSQWFAPGQNGQLTSGNGQLFAPSGNGNESYGNSSGLAMNGGYGSGTTQMPGPRMGGLPIRSPYQGPGHPTTGPMGIPGTDGASDTGGMQMPHGDPQGGFGDGATTGQYIPGQYGGGMDPASAPTGPMDFSGAMSRWQGMNPNWKGASAPQSGFGGGSYGNSSGLAMNGGYGSGTAQMPGNPTTSQGMFNQWQGGPRMAPWGFK